MMDVLVLLMAVLMVILVAMVALLARQVEQLRANMLATNKALVELTRRVNTYYTELAR